MAPLGRLAIYEKMDMHLIWGNGRIFLKPIPDFSFHLLFGKPIWSVRKAVNVAGNKVRGSVVIVQEKS